jgi:hypothetical protein
MIRRAIAILGLCLVGGCAQMSARMGESDVSHQLAYLIGYVQGVAAMRPDAQRRELNDANQIYAKDHDVNARLRLALLLTLPGTPYTDDARAASLLEPLVGPGADASAAGPMRQFAAWLYAQIGERTREQRKSAQLKDQLDQLRAIERALNERGQGQAR